MAERELKKRTAPARDTGTVTEDAPPKVAYISQTPAGSDAERLSVTPPPFVWYQAPARTTEPQAKLPVGSLFASTKLPDRLVTLTPPAPHSLLES